jgi:hypothetical protein
MERPALDALYRWRGEHRRSRFLGRQLFWWYLSLPKLRRHGERCVDSNQRHDPPPFRMANRSAAVRIGCWRPSQVGLSMRLRQ